MIEIKLDHGNAIIRNERCVNSMHKATFLCAPGEEGCQCSFGQCKVKVEIEYNGHSPYTYILTGEEINNLPVEKVEEIPLFEGTIESLSKIKI